jgi:hypothetical protein
LKVASREDFLSKTTSKFENAYFDM